MYYYSLYSLLFLLVPKWIHQWKSLTEWSETGQHCTMSLELTSLTLGHDSDEQITLTSEGNLGKSLWLPGPQFLQIKNNKAKQRLLLPTKFYK